MNKTEFKAELLEYLIIARMHLKNGDLTDAREVVQIAQDMLNKNFCSIPKFGLFDNLEFQGKIDRIREKIAKQEGGEPG